MAFPTPFNINTVMGIPGPVGPQGSPGLTYTITTASFIQPAVDGLVTVSVEDTSMFLIGVLLAVENGGSYYVNDIFSATSMQLNWPAFETDVPPGAVIPAGSKAVVQGVPGYSGYTFTTTNFVQPAVDAIVTIYVFNSETVGVGSIQFIEGGGYYEVITQTNFNRFTAKNLGYPGNVTPGVTVHSGALVSSAGPIVAGARSVTATVGLEGSGADYICDGTDDDVQIQAALDFVDAAGGGEVVIRSGIYFVTSMLTIYSNINLRGENRWSVELRTPTTGSGQGITGGIMLFGLDLSYVSVTDLRFYGVGILGNTCAGLFFDRSVNPNTSHITLKRLVFNGMVGNGVEIDEPVMNVYEDIRVNGCTLNGMSVYNGTSTTFLNCYSQQCLNSAFKLNAMTYSSLISCAGEQSGFNYEIVAGSCLSLLACGSEVPNDISASYPGTHYKVSDAVNVSLMNCFATGFQTGAGSGDKEYIHIVGATVNCRVSGFRGKSGAQAVTPTYAWRVNSGGQLILENCVFEGLNATTTQGVLIKDEGTNPGTLLLKSLAGDSKVWLDRFDTTHFAHILMRTNGVSQWGAGLYTDATNDYQFRDVVNSRTPLKIVQSTGFVTVSVGFDANSTKVVNVLDPVSAQDAATKNFVETGTSTFTNKRVTKRVQTLTDAATVTPATDSYDGGKLLTLSQTTTIANPTGTPTAFQQYILRVLSASTQTLSWGAQFRGSTSIPLPGATTGSSKTDYFGFQWNADSSTWDLIALVQGF